MPPSPRVAHEKAERFLREETAFRLGALLTESPHAKTLTLGETLRADLAAGLRQLLSVDEDIAPAVRRVFEQDSAFPRLRETIAAVLRRGGRLFFTGCGATGRLSILLEAMWRTFWQDLAVREPACAAWAADMAGRVRSVMAGGDFALIKSVEGFEDFPAFGRRQLREAGVAAGDLVVAVTEGGETPFVIGTAWEGLAAGAAVFFVFNNPAGQLRRQVERSREVLDDARIVNLDLTTGPMAVTGSTRMQATTSELLVLGAALELALRDLLASAAGPALAQRFASPALGAAECAEGFARLQATLAGDACVAALARLVELEESVYVRQGRVTYLAGSLLLDILTDTTERSPTFMVPPFRMEGDTHSPVSWAFVKHPLMPTPEAWEALLARAPRSLAWTGATYAALGAPEALRERPPALDADTIRRFRIGNEPDPSRTSGRDSALVLVLAGTDRPAAARLMAAFQRQASDYRRQSVWALGEDAGGPDGPALCVPVAVPPSPLRLWTHLTVKLVMNTVSTATMGRLGRVHGNGMVWVSPSNKKLIDRGTRLVAQQTGLDYEAACHALHLALDTVRAMQAAGEEAPSPVALAIETVRKQGIHHD